MRGIAKIGRGLFGGAVLSALGVGVTQAFAGPPEQAMRACSRFLCQADCGGKGASRGECVGGECVCYL